MTKKEEAQQIRIEDFDYPLPDERIAKFPLAKRDESKLLLYRQGAVGETQFKHITRFLPAGSLIVFNNTRVIQARLLFRKPTGARIEVFCLEPVEPHDYALVFQQTERCRWMCLVGNLKKWKEGTLSREVLVGGETVLLKAERLQSCGDSHLIEFTWDHPTCTFADLLDAAGVLPIPPYLNRETEASDLQTYQTVYSKVKGSVAAPTAGLHFTPEVLADIDAQGIGREEVTLHVGAGTFKPVKSETIEGHEMHTEFISVLLPSEPPLCGRSKACIISGLRWLPTRMRRQRSWWWTSGCPTTRRTTGCRWRRRCSKSWIIWTATE